VFATTVLFIAACSENSDQIVSNGGAPATATVEAKAAAADATTSTAPPLNAPTGGLWFTPERITAGAGGTLVTGMGGVAQVTPSGVTMVLHAPNINAALAAAGETWLAYTEPKNDDGFRLIVGTIGADGAASPRFEVPVRVHDPFIRASISAAGDYLAFLWRLPSGSNWNPGRLVVSADGGKSFRLVDTPTGGGIAISPSGSAVIVGGPGHDQIFAAENVLTDAFVDVTPKLTADQLFHDPIYVNGRFTALQVSRATIPNITTVISSQDNGHSWAHSDFAGNAPLQLDLGTFQIASTDGMTVSTLSTSGTCAGLKSGCTSTAAVRYSIDAGKSFQTVAAYVTPT
jgi:hypothetical protein